MNVLYAPSTQVEAFFEGQSNVYKDAPVNFASKKSDIKEAGTARNNVADASRSIGTFAGEFFTTTTINGLGLNSTSDTLDWVDELDPPIKAEYDAINQRLEFTVDRTVLGTGTDSNFNSFTLYGRATATDLKWFRHSVNR